MAHFKVAEPPTFDSAYDTAHGLDASDPYLSYRRLEAFFEDELADGWTFIGVSNGAYFFTASGK